MAVAYKRGTTTGPSDLAITIRDMNGNLIDPFRLEYAIYDTTTGLQVLMGSPVNTPIRTSVGQFYAQVVIPADANIGDWIIRWTIQESSSDPVYQTAQPFNVIGDNTIPSFTGDANMDKLIHSLRILLRDANPDRNYRFRPPASEKYIQGQTQVFGFVWEDEELLEYLYMAVDDFNSRPPVTGIQLSNLWGTERNWRTAILVRAAAFACFAAAMNWIVDEYSLDKNERITVQDKSGNEYSLTVRELFDLLHGDQIVEQVKKEINEAFKELGHDREISIEAKVAHEYAVLRESFLTGDLKVKSMVDKGPEPAWTPMNDILRHFTPHKRMIRVQTDVGPVVVTEDHSLFDWATKDPIKASDLKIGDRIVGVPGKHFDGIKVIDIQQVDAEEHTYDVSVPGAENAVLDSGILVHNSYSISGVSLDLEKSSKYQAMKDEMIGEYDKLVDAAKASIKIIKGLRQFRYGVGITSALGPLNRPGVQSRRNMIDNSLGVGYI
jgi:hypothetical protein